MRRESPPLRLARSHHTAKGRPIRFEHHVRPRPRAALGLVDSSRIRLKLLTVVGQQRESHAVAWHERYDAQRESLEGKRHVDRARENLQEGIVHLELLDLVERRGPRVLVLTNRLRETADTASRHGRKRQDNNPGRRYLDDDNRPSRDPACDRPRHRLDEGEHEDETPYAGDGDARVPEVHVALPSIRLKPEPLTNTE